MSNVPRMTMAALKGLAVEEGCMLEIELAAKTAECDALKHDIARHVQTCAELATECERLREDATRTLWAVVFAAGGDVAVPHSLLISQDKQNILERIEYPSMTTVFKAARKETP